MPVTPSPGQIAWTQADHSLRCTESGDIWVFEPRGPICHPLWASGLLRVLSVVFGFPPAPFSLFSLRKEKAHTHKGRKNKEPRRTNSVLSLADISEVLGGGL